MPVPIVAVDPTLPTVTAEPSPAAFAFDPAVSAADELERQLRVYDELGVAALGGIALDEVRAAARAIVGSSDLPPPCGNGWASHPDDAVPFVLVLPGIDVNAAVPAMRRGRRPLGALHGVSVIGDDELSGYHTANGIEVPDGAYLLSGIDTGSEFAGLTPERATTSVLSRGRTPLTIAEGVALTILRPDVLRPNRCYSLAGSRIPGNQRVPAVWISQRRAKLGWCWDRNPHAWLGLASAGARRAAPAGALAGAGARGVQQ